MMLGGVGSERKQKQKKERQEQGQLEVHPGASFPPTEPPLQIRIVLGANGQLPPGALYMGRSVGPNGQPKGWENACRSHGPDAAAHAEAVSQFRERLWSPAGKWHRLGMYHLIKRRCGCHCAAHLPCHVDALLDAFLRLTTRRAAFMRLPKLDGLSLPEAGLHLRAHVEWLAKALGLGPHGKWKLDGTEREAQRRMLFSVLFCIARRSHDRRGGLSRGRAAGRIKMCRFLSYELAQMRFYTWRSGHSAGWARCTEVFRGDFGTVGSAAGSDNTPIGRHP